MGTFYKLGSDEALERLGIKTPEGYFGISGPGSGAVMGAAGGSGLATSANTIAKLLGYDLTKSTGLSLPEITALGGALGAGAGGLFGLTQGK